MSERTTGTWFYIPQKGDTFFLYQEGEKEPTLAAVVFSQATADFICEKLNACPTSD